MPSFGLQSDQLSYVSNFHFTDHRIVSTCVLVTLFARYADMERFPVSAYVNIGLTYLLSLSSIGLLGIDLAYTLKMRSQNESG